MASDGAPALDQPVPVVVIRRGVSFKPVLKTGGKTTFSMEKLKELLYEKEPQRNKPKTKQQKRPKNQKRPKIHKQRM